MGVVLSAPISSKYIERRGNAHVRAACASMQGFRVEMEDAHTLSLSCNKHNPNLMLFGVYDGHGGGTLTRGIPSASMASIL
jgi:serine/threonine protein phosphatase PrpC